MDSNIEDLHKKLYEMLCHFDDFCAKNGIKYFLAYGSVLGAARHNGFIPWDDDLDIMMTRDNYDKFLLAYKSNDKYFLQKDTVDYPLQFSKLRCNNTSFIEDINYKKKYKNIHQGIYLDIFSLDTASDNKFYYFLQVMCSNILITQSLYLRGYNTRNIIKLFLMILSQILMPFRKIMLNFVKSFKTSNYYATFYGLTKKTRLPKYLIDKQILLKFEKANFPVPNNYTEYLELTYGNWQQLPKESERKKKIHALFFSVDTDYQNFLRKSKL